MITAFGRSSSRVSDIVVEGGKIYATENGCFAKTFGLNPTDEPTIYYACASSHAYLENVSQDDNGKIDYFDTSYTPNGRAVSDLICAIPSRTSSTAL